MFIVDSFFIRESHDSRRFSLVYSELAADKTDKTGLFHFYQRMYFRHFKIHTASPAISIVELELKLRFSNEHDVPERSKKKRASLELM